MKFALFVFPAFFSIGTALAASQPEFSCVLDQMCNEGKDCTTPQLALRFIGSPLERIETDLGTFQINHMIKADAQLDKLHVSGAEWLVSSAQPMLMASVKFDDRTIQLSATVNPKGMMTATLITVPRRYEDYYDDTPRIFAGQCEGMF